MVTLRAARNEDIIMKPQSLEGRVIDAGGPKGSVGRLGLFKKIEQFLRDVATELKKVSWTSRRELVDSTIVVVASIFALAVIVGILDYFLTMILDKLIR